MTFEPVRDHHIHRCIITEKACLNLFRRWSTIAQVRIKPRLLDFVAILIGIVVVVLISTAAYRRPARSREVHITSSRGDWIYSITEDRVIDVEGPLGITQVSIADEAVRVLDSPCPQKLCILKGAITAAGHWNACLPNQVFLSMEGPRGTKGDSVDAQTH